VRFTRGPAQSWGPARQIDANDHPAYVKNNGARRFVEGGI